MKYYEALYIVNPNFEQDRLEEITKEVEEKILSYDFKVINNRPWGKKRLAYNIDKHKYGTFVLLQFELQDPEKLPNFNRFMELHKAILRNQVIRLDERPEVYTEPEPGEVEKQKAGDDPEKSLPEDKKEAPELSEKKEQPSKAAAEEPEKAADEPEAAVAEPETEEKEPEAAVDEPEVAPEEPEKAADEPEEIIESPAGTEDKDQPETEESTKETEEQSKEIQE